MLPVPPDIDEAEAVGLSPPCGHAVAGADAERALDDLTGLASHVLEMPMALIHLMDHERTWVKSSVGLDVSETSHLSAFCDHAVLECDVMVVPDVARDPRFMVHPMVTKAPHIRFFAGAPLLNAEGDVLGTLCVMDRQSRAFDAHQRAVLITLSHQIVAQLAWRKCNAALLAATASLRRQTHLLDNLSRHVPGVIFQYQMFPNGSACFPFVSEGIRDIYELTPEQVRDGARDVFYRIHPLDRQAVLTAVEISGATLLPWKQEYRVVLPRRGECWRQGVAQPEKLADGSVLWHGIVTDITDRKRAEDTTHKLAYFDALTGLPNRRMLIDRLEQALGSMKRQGQMGALLFIDLDNFKQINDARGHSVGDALLQQVALRLSSLLRHDDTVARLGGDEFVIQVGNLGSDAEAAARQACTVAEKVREVLESRYDIDGFPYNSSGSIGITLFPRGDECVDDLLREADTAMYRAKEGGRNRVEFFEMAMQAEVAERLAMEHDMQEGIEAGQFFLHMQPQVDVRGEVVGGELLLRWTHPVRGAVPPNQFIPMAEDSALILHLGDFVMRQACQALAQLQHAGFALDLSVNVSPRQFRRADFVGRVQDALKSSGASPHSLILEVTEGLLIENLNDTVSRMDELVALGIRFSIDDFGTGYSSLAYLKKLPLYELKIDRTFVRDTPNDPNDTAIVEAILSVSKHLGLRVVAEGVETREQADFLLSRGCDCLQGYFYGRPEPLDTWMDSKLAGKI
jgi:diguanylate cyclase (GGDEF)-like protein